MKKAENIYVFIAYFPFLPDSDTCCCGDNCGYIGDYVRGACFSSGGDGRDGIGVSFVFICGSLIDESKKNASVWIVAFLLFVPGGDCSGLDGGGIGACYIFW